MSKTDFLMAKLGCTVEEAVALIEADKKIDKGEKLFELSEDLKQGAKKARQAPRKPITLPTKRERKPDEEKRHIVQYLFDAVTNADWGDTPIIVREEGEIVFDYHGRKFKIVLSAPRT